jgi:hypothetical protein
VLPSRDNEMRLVGDTDPCIAAPCFATGEAIFLMTEFELSIGPSDDVAGSADIALELASSCSANIHSLNNNRIKVKTRLRYRVIVALRASEGYAPRTGASRPHRADMTCGFRGRVVFSLGGVDGDERAGTF